MNTYVFSTNETQRHLPQVDVVEKARRSPRKQKLEIVKGREDDNGTVIVDTFEERDVDTDFEFDISSQNSTELNTLPDFNPNKGYELNRNELYILPLSTPPPTVSRVTTTVQNTVPTVSNAASDNLGDVDINYLFCDGKNEDISPFLHRYGKNQENVSVFGNLDYYIEMCLQNSDFNFSLPDTDLLSDDTQ